MSIPKIIWAARISPNGLHSQEAIECKYSKTDKMYHSSQGMVVEYIGLNDEEENEVTFSSTKIDDVHIWLSGAITAYEQMKRLIEVASLGGK